MNEQEKTELTPDLFILIKELVSEYCHLYARQLSLSHHHFKVASDEEHERLAALSENIDQQIVDLEKQLIDRCTNFLLDAVEVKEALRLIDCLWFEEVRGAIGSPRVKIHEPAVKKILFGNQEEVYRLLENIGIGRRNIQDLRSKAEDLYSRTPAAYIDVSIFRSELQREWLNEFVSKKAQILKKAFIKVQQQNLENEIG